MTKWAESIEILEKVSSVNKISKACKYQMAIANCPNLSHNDQSDSQLNSPRVNNSQ